jgi:thiazole synthase
MRVYGTELSSRLLLGTALYSSPAVMTAAIRASKAAVVTVSLRREAAQAEEGAGAGQRFWGLVRDLGLRVLPNGAYGARGFRHLLDQA